MGVGDATHAHRRHQRPLAHRQQQCDSILTPSVDFHLRRGRIRRRGQKLNVWRLGELDHLRTGPAGYPLRLGVKSRHGCGKMLWRRQQCRWREGWRRHRTVTGMAFAAP